MSLKKKSTMQCLAKKNYYKLSYKKNSIINPHTKKIQKKIYHEMSYEKKFEKKSMMKFEKKFMM